MRFPSLLRRCSAPMILLLFAAAMQAGGSGYHLLKKITLGGPGVYWDYLTFDSATHRLFIAHATKVDVLDVETGKLAGEIPDTLGVHGIALAPELARGFTSNGQSSTVTIFDLKTLKVLGTVKTTGNTPDAIVYDPASKRVFTMNGRSDNSTAIDAATGRSRGRSIWAAGPNLLWRTARGAFTSIWKIRARSWRWIRRR